MPTVHLEARSDRFDEDDERWQSQVSLLHGALDEAECPLERRFVPATGTKGALSDVVLQLTSPGIVAGVVTALVAWLKRDRGRSVRLTWTVDGRRGEFVATGTTIDSETLRSALEHGLRATLGDDSSAPDEPDALNGAPGD
ncbi:hypothetical protein [Streptomyces sp. NBC_00102]|uniref:effector-associated constant component EACC1 n=1 Tax=Streptomyces sp. NBC_00102 TaxID=2975652 RepID=UPI002259B56A|nr:hypothetical protein [Streptomyces sp. NBC_00102]MCX5401204.1 hypothetical protein [Streptomyces sp. NBC_00102]